MTRNIQSFTSLMTWTAPCGCPVWMMPRSMLRERHRIVAQNSAAQSTANRHDVQSLRVSQSHPTPPNTHSCPAAALPYLSVLSHNHLNLPQTRQSALPPDSADDATNTLERDKQSRLPRQPTPSTLSSRFQHHTQALACMYDQPWTSSNEFTVLQRARY